MRACCTIPGPVTGKQKNFAQKNATHDWILNIDGDEEVPEPLVSEIQRALEKVGAGQSNLKGFRFPP